MSNEYIIKTLQDMLEKIPIEKFDNFLSEFAEQIKIVKSIYETLNGIEKINMNDLEMIWKDDNKKNINMRISNPENIKENVRIAIYPANGRE
ncbi:MAG TPA: hypothetical protein PKY81_17020 [bacterium]|nr:hypothetical protein [bacterium]